MESRTSNTQKVEHRGYLSKRGHVVPNWKMRFFVLEAEGGACSMRYYKSAQVRSRSWDLDLHARSTRLLLVVAKRPLIKLTGPVFKRSF